MKWMSPMRMRAGRQYRPWASARVAVDFLVNNAASFIAKGLDVTTADRERSLGVNVRGLCQHGAGLPPVLYAHHAWRCHC